jgi:hypothetical protein
MSWGSSAPELLATAAVKKIAADGQCCPDWASSSNNGNRKRQMASVLQQHFFLCLRSLAVVSGSSQP